MIKSISRVALTSIGVACIFQFMLHIIQSQFVFLFLKSNITILQVALLAINGATLGIVLTKVKDIIDKNGKREEFMSAKREMLLSIKEQVALIIISLAVISLATAKCPPFNFSNEIYQILLIASFLYSLQILYDTTKSVFLILDF